MARRAHLRPVEPFSGVVLGQRAPLAQTEVRKAALSHPLHEASFVKPAFPWTELAKAEQLLVLASVVRMATLEIPSPP